MSGKNRLAILGSTGSVGLSTLQVVRENHGVEVVALSAHNNTDLLLKQCQEFKPHYVVLSDETKGDEFAALLKAAGFPGELLLGPEGLEQIAASPEVDSVMAAIVGAAGLASSLKAAETGKKLLLANKESLVMSGSLFMDAARRGGATIIPIDSEHNAIFQCLPESERHSPLLNSQQIVKLVLTASGGPFLRLDLNQLADVTPEQACDHPRWSMGRKISVDSASMMNKGLEVIEACFLFGISPQNIEVLIHPESIIHSLVYYRDGSVLAQMANPDMRVPIAHGLAYPQRIDSGVESLDLVSLGSLSFEAPDFQRFPCLRLGREAVVQGGTTPAVLNAANEEAVAAFLAGRIGFDKIPFIIEELMLKTPCEEAASLAIIREADERTRTLAKQLISKRFA